MAIAPESGATLALPPGAIEIEFATGARMRVTGRGFDGRGDGRGAGEAQAAMIPVRGGAQVWLATGHTDMRNRPTNAWRLAVLAWRRWSRTSKPGSVPNGPSCPATPRSPRRWISCCTKVKTTGVPNESPLAAAAVPINSKLEI